MKQISIIGFLIILLINIGYAFGQQTFNALMPVVTDTLNHLATPQPGGLFTLFGGGINSLYNKGQSGTSLDISVQTYHYFLITRRRFRNDSIHEKLSRSANIKPITLYRGVDFYVLSRAVINLDSLKSMASDYISSTLASPLTLRMSKKIYLSSNENITANDLRPVFAFNILTDVRVIPYNDRLQSVQLGISGNLHLNLQAQFKRYELDKNGQQTDQGLLYLQPGIGIAYGSQNMMETILRPNAPPILLSTEVKLGITSDDHPVNDCALLVRYTLTEIAGPRLRVGLTVSAGH